MLFLILLGSGGEGDSKKGGKKKFITKEQEPEYWQTSGEREGENPMKTPLPYIIIFVIQDLLAAGGPEADYSGEDCFVLVGFRNQHKGQQEKLGSRTWLALVPIFAVFTRLSSGHGAVLFPITFIFLSTIVLFAFSKRKPIMPANPMLKEAPLVENEQTPKEIPSHYDSIETVPSPARAEKDKREVATKGIEDEVLMASQDLYSESESMDQCSSTSSEDHSSDMEWPYNIGQRMECSDGSISDEESLIEIAIPTGQFVSPEKVLRWNVKCCKLSQDFCDPGSMFDKDFWAEIYQMNEEDNLIEIDINIGSIKC